MSPSPSVAPLPGHARMVPLGPKGDRRGQLVAIESLTAECPFQIRRAYYIYDTTPGTVRGRHAHRQLRQLIVCVSGSCAVRCLDGTGVNEFILDWPDRALYIEGLVWREMLNFSKGAVLLVLASELYDERDYIRDYQEFLDLSNRRSTE